MAIQLAYKLMGSTASSLLNLQASSCAFFSALFLLLISVAMHMEMKRVPSSVKSGNGKPEASLGLLRMRSFEFERESSGTQEFIRKTKSLSSQFLINVDELVKNVSGSFNESGFLACGSSGNQLNFPVAFHGISCSSGRFAGDYPGGHQEEASTFHDSLDPCRWQNNEQVAPSLPICLRFQDVKYKIAVQGVMNNSSEKYILHGVSGSANPGEFLALIGPSGGGKTTLLNLLSGRDKFHSGTITYNDKPYSKSLKHKMGFVLQDDVVYPHLTVTETLTYAALLRLPNKLTREQKKDAAMKVILDLGLERCQDTVVGDRYVKGISGGERKRVCIGTEILLNPPLLFLDEPTSSLDSAAALRIVQMLHSMARAGRTVVTTIHQPSSRLFSEFDKLILMGKGNSLYFGKASEAMMYFSSLGCSPLVSMNPAEFLIDLANGNMNDKSIPGELEDKFSLEHKNKSQRPSTAEVHKYIVDAYEARCCRTKKAKPHNLALEKQKTKSAESRMSTGDLGANWRDQFLILLSRGLKERRHEYFSSIRIVQVISTAIIIGLLWWHPNPSTPQDLQDQAGVLFFISVFWGFFPLFTAIFTFPQERAMLIKERSRGMYKLSAYFAARNVTDLPLDLILPTVFILIVYFMVGLTPSFAAFSLTLLAIFFDIVAAQGLGQCIGASFMDVKKAMTVASVIVMSFMLSGGFFLQDVPSFMSWVRYASFNYHTYRILLRIQYGCSTGISRKCNGHHEAPQIKGFKINYSGEAEVGALMVMTVGYRLLAYFFLRRMKVRTIM